MNKPTEQGSLKALTAARAKFMEALEARLVCAASNSESIRATAEIEWISPEESAELARHWAEDLGANRYGRLALIAPAEGSMRGDFSLGSIPDWLAERATSVCVLLQNYPAIGIFHCSWKFVRENIAALALVDGNGFAAVSDELSGVLLADVEYRDNVATLEIAAWGDLIAV